MLWEPEYRKSTCSDIELATEIGQGLLTEVRKMQAALQEKQETLAHLEFERSENQQLIDELSKQLRFKNDAEGNAENHFTDTA
jgi:hypothetical protein